MFGRNGDPGSNARLLMVPPGGSVDDSRHQLEAFEQMWNALVRYGSERLEPEGWRHAGIGAVTLSVPGFRRFADDLAGVWATLDLVDEWGQSVVDVARRQHHWFGPAERPFLDRVWRSRFDLYVVDERSAPGVVLRRVADDTRLVLHATLDAGAYPGGAMIVARIVDGPMRISLASCVVDPHRIARCMRGEAGSAASDRLFGAALDRFARRASEARDSSLEPRLGEVSPASYRRLNRAKRALLAALSLKGGRGHRWKDLEGRVLTASAVGDLHVTLSDGRRLTVSERPAEVCAPFDVELAAQSGVGLQPGSLTAIDPSPPRPVTSRDADAAAQIFARAALAIIGEQRAAA